MLLSYKIFRTAYEQGLEPFLVEFLLLSLQIAVAIANYAVIEIVDNV